MWLGATATADCLAKVRRDGIARVFTCGILFWICRCFHRASLVNRPDREHDCGILGRDWVHSRHTFHGWGRFGVQFCMRGRRQHVNDSRNYLPIVVHFENLPYHWFTGKTIGKNNLPVKILVKFSMQKDSEIFSVL